MDKVNHVLGLLGLAAILGYPLVFVVRDPARKKHNTLQQTIILGAVATRNQDGAHWVGGD
ncbi:MAG: hypothetical protein HYZ25_04320 [Chloroflexi bacterium]|nr:hypothetical protein [Chloroflexota bacterium]